MYGHVAKLAEEIKKGASSVEGVEVKIWQVSFNSQVSNFIFVLNNAQLTTISQCNPSLLWSSGFRIIQFFFPEKLIIQELPLISKKKKRSAKNYYATVYIFKCMMLLTFNLIFDYSFY